MISCRIKFHARIYCRVFLELQKVILEEKWHSGRDLYSYILYLPQTYLRLWIQFPSSPLYWVTA